MAKPVSKAKKKSRRVAEIEELVRPQSAKKREREINAFINSMDEASEEREKWVKMMLAVNDDSVLEIVDHVVQSLKAMATGHSSEEIYFMFKGQKLNARNDAERELIVQIATRNRRWVAVRLLVAAAEQDVQIGRFKLPKKKCARCGKPAVKISKKPKKKGKK